MVGRIQALLPKTGETDLPAPIREYKLDHTVRPASARITYADGLWRNPRHVPLSEEGQRELRQRIGSVVVDGADVMREAGAGRSKRKLEEYKIGSEVSILMYHWIALTHQ
jgi:hypothetical protein